MEFCLYSQKVTHASLESSFKLIEKVYVQQSGAYMDIFGLMNNELYKFSKPLHDICKIRGYWKVYLEHIVNDLQMSPVACDDALYVRKRNLERHL